MRRFFCQRTLPVGGLEADKVAVGAEGVEQFAVDGRRGCEPRGSWALVRVADFADARGPGLLAVRDFQCPDELVVDALVAHQVEALADDRGRRVAVADVLDLPEQLGPVLGPFLEQARFLRDAVALGPAPLGPIGSASRQGE